MSTDLPLAQRDALGNFASRYLRAFVAPRATFDELVRSPDRVPFAFGSVLVTASLYTVIYVLLARGGGYPSSFDPWLAIPAADYYRYDIAFAAPCIFAGWILSAGVVHLASRFARGRGSFEDTLAVLGLGLSAASWTTGLHDLALGILGNVGALDLPAHELAMNAPGIARTVLWVALVAYAAAFLVLFTIGLGAAQRIRVAPAMGLAVVALVVYQSVLFLFLRCAHARRSRTTLATRQPTPIDPQRAICAAPALAPTAVSVAALSAVM